MYIETKLKSPYILKFSTGVGWWIDGYCGYSFISYCKTKKECMEQFKKKRKK